MKKTLVTLSLLLGCAAAFGQNFEKGYIITIDGERKECEIDNKDWPVNPEKISYKIADQVTTGDVKNIKEFGVYGYSVYERHIVKAAFPTKDVEDEPAYPWQTDTLFLQVMLEGNPSLYCCKTSFAPVYFYQGKDDAAPLQLRHRLSSQNGNIQKDNAFRNQLSLFAANCGSNVTTSLSRLEYRGQALLDMFKQINACNKTEYTEIKRTKESTIEAHLQFRPGFVMNNLSIKGSGRPYTDYASGFKPSYRLGLGVEINSRARLKKWSLLIELAYQDFKQEERINVDYKFYGTLREIDLMVGVRRYLVATQGLKLYVGAYAGLTPVRIKSQTEYKMVYSFSETEVSAYKLDNTIALQFAAGCGIKYKRLGLELAYGIPHSVTATQSWSSNYSRISAIGSIDLF